MSKAFLTSRKTHAVRSSLPNNHRIYVRTGPVYSYGATRITRLDLSSSTTHTYSYHGRALPYIVAPVEQKPSVSDRHMGPSCCDCLVCCKLKKGTHTRLPHRSIATCKCKYSVPSASRDTKGSALEVFSQSHKHGCRRYVRTA